MAHKEFPKQSAAVILNHDSYRPLVDGKITLRIPVVRFAESVVESVRAEHLVAHVVKVAHHLQRILRCIYDGRKGGGGSDDSPVVALVGRVGGIPVCGVAGGQSPAVRSEAFVMFGVTDAVGAVHKREVTHFAEVIGAILVFQPVGVESQERVLRPEQRTGFRALIPQMQFDSLYLMRADDGAVLRPAFVVYGGGHAMRRRGGGKDVHDEALVVAVHGEVHLPAVFRAPMPVEHVLVALAVEVPVYFLP